MPAPPASERAPGSAARRGRRLGGWLLGELELRTFWEAFWWLLTLALTSQVLGWLLIAAALSRAPVTTELNAD